MPRIDLAEDEERARVVATIDSWAQRELEAGAALIAVERQEVSDRTASHRWLLRFRGESHHFAHRFFGSFRSLLCPFFQIINDKLS